MQKLGMDFEIFYTKIDNFFLKLRGGERVSKLSSSGPLLKCPQGPRLGHIYHVGDRDPNISAIHLLPLRMCVSKKLRLGGEPGALIGATAAVAAGAIRSILLCEGLGEWWVNIRTALLPEHQGAAQKANPRLLFSKQLLLEAMY